MEMLSPFRRACLEMETLEDRVVPSASAPDVDLSAHGSIGAVNGAIFRQFDAQPTGTGVIDSFVRLQSPNAKVAVQQGYNTDGRPLQFDENKSPVFTRSLQLGAVPEVDIGGVKYREFLLDINQKASQPFLSLDSLRIFVGGQGNLTGYSSATNQLNGLNAVYDLDSGADHWVKLDARLNQGSGKGDMLLYVPSAVFAGHGANDFVYLYSKFGVNFAGNAGFEEWAVSKGGSGVTDTSGAIHGKVTDSNGNPLVDVTLFIDANNNGVLDQDEIFTTTDSNGNYSFDDLATGLGSFSTYTIRELPPNDYQSGATSRVVHLDYTNEIFTLDLVNVLGGGSSSGGGDTGGGGGGTTPPPA